MKPEKRFRGKLSNDYDAVCPTVLGYRSLHRNMARVVAKYYRGGSAIELGMGTGYTTFELVHRGRLGRVVAVEVESSMIRQAERNLSEFVVEGRVEIKRTDALSYLRTVPQNSVDVVAVAFTIHNFVRAYRHRVIAETYRVLRPGGIFISIEKYASDDFREYVRAMTNQIIAFDRLEQSGRSDLRRLWIEHEVEDQHPERIMWTAESFEEFRRIGFRRVSELSRIGQYALAKAEKPTTSSQRRRRP